MTPAPRTPERPDAAESAAATTREDVPRIGRGFRLQWETAQDAWVLLYPEGMVKLNGSAGEILSRCDGAKTVAAVVAELEERFGRTGLERDVLAFLDLAREQRWVELA